MSSTTTTTTMTTPTTVTFLGIHPLHHSKLWYFITFGAFACITPYLPLFYREWGVSADQVGFINCLRPLVSFTFTPLWGAAADASGRHNVIFFSMMLVQGYGYAGLSQIPHTFHALFTYVVALEARRGAEEKTERKPSQHTRAESYERSNVSPACTFVFVSPFVSALLACTGTAV